MNKIPKPLRPFAFAASCAIALPTLIGAVALGVYYFGLLIRFPEPLAGFTSIVTAVVLTAVTAAPAVLIFERLLEDATK